MEIPILKSLGHTCSSGNSDSCPVPCNENVNDCGWGKLIPGGCTELTCPHPSTALPSGIDVPKGYPQLTAQVFQLLRG